MTLWLLALLLTPGPDAVIIATSRGETRVPVATVGGAFAVAAPHLAGPLGLRLTLDGAEATVVLAGAEFRFQLDAPYVRTGNATYSLVNAPYRVRDTLFLPLHWLTEFVPRVLSDRYRWDPAAARLLELSRPPTAPVAAAYAATEAPHPLTGLRHRHRIVIDPGHGGRDPGNPGLFFPDGLSEKHVTLAIGRLLRAELTQRGVHATMTRTSDTLIDLADRGAACGSECDLFVSIHVNAMPRGRRQQVPGGVETYFLSDAKTEDQKRVADMENEAIRFETDAPVS
jgi:N-acetylmuramoyl-L-alanine amidase